MHIIFKEKGLIITRKLAQVSVFESIEHKVSFMADVKRHEMKQQQKPVQKGTVVLMELMEDVRALNSAVTLLSQKMKHLIRNEKILGRNLIVLNRRVKEVAEGRSGAATVSGDFSQIEPRLKELNEKIEALNIELNELKASSVPAETIKELKYVVDSINPLEYTTIDQVKAMIEEKLGGSEKKKRH